MRAPSRRSLLRGAPLALGGAFGGALAPSLLSSLVPSALAARPALAGDRMFLFVVAQGGWDPTWVYAPMMGSPDVYSDPDGAVATASGLTYVDGPGRPAVADFFDRYASRAAILNGFEVRSVTHERCRRILMTGSSGQDADDWGATIAGAALDRPLPHLVLSGPAYTSLYTPAVVRVGVSGQLAGLVDGTALDTCTPPVAPPSAATVADVDAYLRRRLAALPAGAGREAEFVAALASAQDRLELVRSLDDLDLSFVNNGVITSVYERVQPAITCFERGYSRCAMVAHDGLFNLGWDSHAAIAMQAEHYQILFDDLTRIVQDLETRRGPSGAPLIDEVTVVLLSEMGRAPALNATGGKDHWTFTSALLLGAGIRGGQVVGGYDDAFVGRPVDLASGDVSDAGVPLTSAHLGATLMALADLDPGATPPIDALLA